MTIKILIGNLALQSVLVGLNVWLKQWDAAAFCFCAVISIGMIAIYQALVDLKK